MITIMKIILKIKIIIRKIIKKKTQKTNTITTNKTFITYETLTGEERKKETYLLHLNYEKTTLSNMLRKHHDH